MRPVWSPGFAGNGSGFDGDTNITIAIIDSGMDASHSDLAGNGEFWKDYTTDALTTPEDFSQHATHRLDCLGHGREWWRRQPFLAR